MGYFSSAVLLCFHSFVDQFQVSAHLLLETEEVRQNISKLNKEVQFSNKCGVKSTLFAS